MKDNRMKSNKMIVQLMLLAAALSMLLPLFNCGGGSSTSSGGGGGGGTREFVSGNLGDGQSFTHVFNTSKVVPYYCRHHGGPGGVGMSGVITVVAGGSVNKTSVSITSSTLPDLDIDVGDTVTWTNNHFGVVHTVESDN
jgi:hypothetical protein